MPRCPGVCSGRGASLVVLCFGSRFGLHIWSGKWNVLQSASSAEPGQPSKDYAVTLPTKIRLSCRQPDHRSIRCSFTSPKTAHFAEQISARAAGPGAPALDAQALQLPLPQDLGQAGDALFQVPPEGAERQVEE